MHAAGRWLWMMVSVSALSGCSGTVIAPPGPDAAHPLLDGGGGEAPDASGPATDSGSHPGEDAGVEPGRDAASPGADAAQTADTGPDFGKEFFVATDGDDGNPGTLEQPFATLEKARTAARAFVQASGLPERGLGVTLRGGLYPRTSTFTLGAQDSGSADRPVVYRSRPGERARVAGGRVVPSSAFAAVASSSPVWGRLDPAAQGKVLAVDLKAQGITDFGTLVPRGFGAGGSAALEVFVDRKPMPLARWPDPSENDVPTTSADDTVVLYGSPSPDVSGTYVKSGTSDGVNSYTRQGQVGGKDYHLYRYNWDYQGTNYTAWFLTTQTTGYPGDADPWWSLYADELGTMKPSAGGTGEITNRQPGGLNHGFATIAEAVSDTEFRYFGTRPDRWAAATDVWFHGYWRWSWADEHLGAASIDPATRTVTLSKKHGFGLIAGQPYYAENLLEEITEPGEWYLDRGAGLLYLWPPSPIGAAEVVVSTLAGAVVEVSGASFVTLRDLDLEVGRTELVRISGGDHVSVHGCKLLNAGTSAASVEGSDHRVERCEIAYSGDDGVALRGGDRASLTPGNNEVTNCEIHHFGRWTWTYAPGAQVSGAGNRVAHNLFHDAPHTAVLFNGNDHVIEYNEIHDVLFFSSDAGAIYIGRDWGYRGNEIRFNFIHDLSSYFEGYGVHGVYLDDCVSGIRVFGNVLYRISDLGILHGGGRDDVMENNLLVRCGRAMSGDSRGITAINDTPGDSWNFLERLTYDGIQYQQPPWSTRWPELAAIPNDFAAITADGALWRYPEGSVFSRNLGWQNGAWMDESNGDGTGTFNKYKEIQDNVADADPKFVDESKLDLRLQAGSPALAIPGWQPIPFESIGIER
ncbi:MAG TPA: right-handed parallel beta-helix repeat-containing protein [Myxococcales bacterium]